MVTNHVPVSNAAVLAELVDTALADEWHDEGPLLVLMSQDEADPDKVELATKRIEDDPAVEVQVFGPDHECLAVCLSRLEPAGPSGPGLVARLFPVRVTVAIDPHDTVTINRHPDGRTERPASTEGPSVDLLRRSLATLRLSA